MTDQKETPAYDLDRRFGGIARVYGQPALAHFLKAHIAVIGVGGVGSWAAEALARSGIGQITLIDLDNVAESNVNRQIQALSGEFGKSKIDAMQQRIELINPQCHVRLIEDFVTLDNLQAYLDQDYDFIIDCSDNFRIKAGIIAFCQRHKLAVITVGAAGGQADPTKIRVDDLSRSEHDGLLSKLRKLLRADYHFTRSPKRRFYIPCVYSTEQALYPDNQGGVCRKKPTGSDASGLNCEGGIGSVMTVTCSFAMAAVSWVLTRLAQQAEKTS